MACSIRLKTRTVETRGENKEKESLNPGTDNIVIYFVVDDL